MKKLVAKYLLEFLVIVIGISISFYIEKINENTYRDNLKNQSLKRILENIADDTRDFKFNQEALRRAIYSTSWIIDRNRKLKMYSRDSIGFHLNRAVYFNTIFVDNQEEYRGLQNSGLMEMIENENLVSTLQGKYISHEFFKKIESIVIEKTKYLDEFSFNNLKYKSDSLDDLGLQFDRIFVGTKGIPDNIIEVLYDKRFFQSYYLRSIQTRMKNDQELIDIIKEEINLK
jgi:hypothetical protein